MRRYSYLSLGLIVICLLSSCHNLIYRSNELSAFNRIKEIRAAQQTYKSTKGRYGTLNELIDAKLLKSELRGGRYTGYLYEIKVEGDSYTATARPEKYGETTRSRSGGVSLFVDETGVIRHTYGGERATAQDEPWPAQN